MYFCNEGCSERGLIEDEIEDQDLAGVYHHPFVDGRSYRNNPNIKHRFDPSHK